MKGGFLKFIVILSAFFFLAFSMDVGEEGEEIERPFSPEKTRAIWGEPSLKKIQMDLAECIEQALNHNFEVKAGDYSIDAAEGKMDESRRIGKPVMEYEYYLAPVPKNVSTALESFFDGDITVLNRFKVGFGIPLTTFGRLELAKEMAEVGIDAEKKKQELKATEVVLDVKQLYYGVLLARELNRILDGAVKQVKKEIRRREESEEGTNPSDLLKLKIFLFDIEKKLQESSKKETMALEVLKLKLGIPGGTLFDIKGYKLRADRFDEEKFDAYKKEGLRRRADLDLVSLGLKVKNKQYKLEKRGWVPDLGFGAFFEFGRTPGITGLIATDDFSDPFNFTRAGFGLRLKGTFDWFGMSAKMKQAKAEYYKLELQQELAGSAAELDIKDAYLEVKNSELAMHRADEAGKLSRQLLFITQSNFDIGLAEPKDLVDAVQSLLTTRAQYFEAIFNFNVAVAKLHQKVGRLPRLL